MRSLDSPRAGPGRRQAPAAGASAGLGNGARLRARSSASEARTGALLTAGQPRRPVGSVARAIALLDALADSEARSGVNELARRIGVNAEHRFAAARHARGRAGWSSARRGGPYRLGLRLVTLSDRVLGQLDVRERARPLLARLVAETGETATLSVPGGGEAITVDFVPSPSSVVSMARRRAPERPARDRGRAR